MTNVPLVITGDLHGNSVFDALDEPKYLLKTNEKFQCEFEISNSIELFKITQNALSFEIAKVGNILIRRPILWQLNENQPEHIKSFIVNETQEVLNAVLAHTHFSDTHEVFNAGKAYNLARNKIFQLHLAKKIGLSVPATCVTNSEKIAKDFYISKGKNIIYKCLSRPVIHYEDGKNSMIHTSKVLDDNFEKVTICPCLFQENLTKKYELRVAVIGDDVTAVKIDSQDYEETKQDWRKGMDNPLLYSKYELSESLKIKLISMNKHLGINWSMMDLVVSPEGDYVFLEANPDGAWLWLEDYVMGLNLTKKIATRFFNH